VSCGSLPLISDVIVAQNSYVSNTNSSLKELFVSYAFMFQMQLLHATVIAAADLAELAAAGGLGLGLVLLEPEVVVPAMDAAADLVCPWICLAIY
jgi:hypothetical protein